MISSLWKKVLLLAVVLPALGLVVAGTPLSVGQDEKAAEKKVQKGTRRLPSYYADVVSEEQRKQIYDIQAKYAKQLQDLNEQLLALVKKQNDEIEAVLTAEQREKVAAAQAAASAKKKKKAAQKKAADTAKASSKTP
jgi:hypothetical protein